MASLLADNGIITAIDPRWFADAAAHFNEASIQIETLIAQDYARQAQRGELRRLQEGIEAGWTLDGLTRADGTACKNEAERDAARRLLRQSDPDWQRAAEELTDTERGIAFVAGQLERWRDRRSVARKRMEIAVAATSYWANPDNTRNER